MSPRKRNKENQGLPKGWRFRAGKYRFQVPKEDREFWDNKSEFTLGKTLSEAHATFAERMGAQGDVTLMEHLCDRYTLEVIPTKAAATQRSNHLSMKRIRIAFTGNRVASIRPKHVYAYRDHTGKNESKKKANLDLEVLSHMFTKSIEWGVIDDHPMTNKKVVKFSIKPRKVEPIESEMIAFYETLPRKWQLYLNLKIWLARRKGEMLRIQRFDFSEKGIRFINNKNEDDIFIQPWEPETRYLVEEILKLPGATTNQFLFENRSHKPYINLDKTSPKYGQTSGFDTMWQNYMTKAIANEIVTRRFTEHDMRKVRPSQLPADEAQEMLRHTTKKQTKTYQTGATILNLPKGQK